MERREKRFASRILAWFLTFLMITTMIPTSAFAALPTQDTGAVVSEDASSDETTQDGILLKTTLTDKPEKEHRKHRLIPLFIRKPKKANLSVMQRSALKPLQSQKVIS